MLFRSLLDINNGKLVYQDNLIPPAEILLNELSPVLELLLPDLSLKNIRDKIITVANNTANNSSSMRQDLANGKSTEINFINGYLLNFANAHSISLKEHLKIVKQIKALFPN